MKQPFLEQYGGKKRKFRQVLQDSETGEIIDGKEDGTALFIPKPRHNAFSKQEGFYTMSQAAADATAEFFARGKMTGKDAAVLFRLVALLDQQNWIEINQVEFARSLAMKKQHVNRSIGRLEDLGILNPGPKVGLHCTYRLNPLFGWKGPNKQHKNVIIEEMVRRGLSVIEGGNGTFEKAKADVRTLRQKRLRLLVDGADQSQE